MNLRIHPNTARPARRPGSHVSLRRLAAPVLASLATCAFPTDSEPRFAATYVLESVAGEPLPALYLENDFGRLYVEADTLRLGGQGLGERHSVIRAEWTRDIPGPDLQGRRDEFRHDVENGVFILEFPCSPFASCAAAPNAVGRLTADSLVLTYLLGARTPLVYRRLHGDRDNPR